MIENVNMNILDQPKGVGGRRVRKVRAWDEKVNEILSKYTIKDAETTLDRLKDKKGPNRTPFFKQEYIEEYLKEWRPKEDISFKPTKKNAWFSLSEYNDEVIYDEERQEKFIKSLEEDVGRTEIKTMKFRLFPTENEKKEIDKMLEFSLWAKNMSIILIILEVDRHYRVGITDLKKINHRVIRDAFKKYVHTTTSDGRPDFKYIEENNELILPQWATENVHVHVHSHIYRGAVMKTVQSVNAILTNFHAGNIKKFELDHEKKTTPIQSMLFEDLNFPILLRDMKSRYWFRDKNMKRSHISFKDLLPPNRLSDTPLDGKPKPRGLEVVREREPNGTCRYFLHYPVDIDYFYREDQRIQKHHSLSIEKNRSISLDPGVRKFMVGYDSRGRVIKIADKGNKKLHYLLVKIDAEDTEGGDKQLVYERWRKIKNLVNDLHWKTISYLISNYDTILLPDFRIGGMVTKSIPKETKRMLYMYSYFKFKTRLIEKCSRYGKKVVIVDESYTSKTCSCCGSLNNVRGSETYECVRCGMRMDRDVNGAINIYLKNKVYA